MGARGGSHPAGFTQRSVSTIFLRAPWSDYSSLASGHKRQFRMPSSGGRLEKLVAPTPVVLYAVSPAHKQTRHTLAVLVAVRRERLADLASSPESLAAEAVADYQAFKAYWRHRTRRPFRPLDQVDVYEVARWGTVGTLELGQALLRRLYGEYLP